MAERPLSAEEAALWARVLSSVRPLRVAPAPVAKVKPAVIAKPHAASNKVAATKPAAKPGVDERGLFERLLAGGLGSGKGKKSLFGVPPQGSNTASAGRAARPVTSNTLDGSWDKKLSRGLVSPDGSIDLHGHNLSTAYATLDGALEQAIRQGDRVLLLVTGKPPRPESERPHAPQPYRGAIRAAIGDWLAGSRHAGSIAAVRNAHPRHGGAGALYIILKRVAPNRIY